MAVLFDAFKQIFKKDCCVAFTHHHRKNQFSSFNNKQQNMRGSTEILAQVDSHLALDIVDGQIIVTQTKSRYAPEIDPFKLRLVTNDQRSHFEYSGTFNIAEPKYKQILELIPQMLNDHGDQSRRELVEALLSDFGEKSVIKALRVLEEDEIITSRYIQSTGYVYSLTRILDSQSGNTYINEESAKLDESELKGGENIG
jgi:hypothetical protein